MMNSKKLEYTQRRQFRDRSPREWGDHDERWREPQGCRSSTSRDSHRTYYGVHLMDSDGTKEKRQYSDSPQRAYGKEPSSRDRNRRSPARRCVDKDGGGDGEYTRFRYLSPETSTSQEHRFSERRKSLTSDIEDDFKHRRLNSDFRSWPPTKEDIDYGKRPEDSKRRPTPEDFAYRHPSEYAMDRRTQNRNVTRDTKQLPESSSMVYDATRDRNESTSHLNYNHWQPSTSFPGSETSRQAEHNSTNHSPALAKSVTEQSRSNGFQRFLSVLNKGVDVNMLTKIVTQAPTVPDPRNTAEPPGSHRGTGNLDKHQNAVYWNKNNEPQQLQSEQPGKNTLSNEKFDVNHINTGTRVTPMQAVVKVKVTPEEEQKCKEMQNLLQTIGMDLGLEELGKMSNRIQQRLYGNKEDRERRESEKETRRETRQLFSPGCNSRSSSSSRSSFGPPVTQHNSLKKASLGAPANISENDQAASVGNEASIRNYDSDRTCQDSSAALQSTFAPNTTYNLPQPQAPTGVMPSYPSTPFSPHLYPPAAYNAPPPWGVTAGPMPFPPYPPRYLLGHMPYPGLPTFPNYHPAQGQSNTFLQGAGNAHLGYLNLQDPNYQQKSTSRPRCLQVIDTDLANKT